LSDHYGLFTHRIAEPHEPNEEYQTRRALAASLREIQDRLVRLDAPQDMLEHWAAQMATVAEQVRDYPRRGQSAIFQRLYLEQGSHRDVLDAFDHEIMTGLSSSLAPPLSLWLDGDVVRGRANLGLPWQGPPGRVHGGGVALILDILMAKTQDMVEGIGMTGTLNIRYQAGTPLKTDIDMEARIQRLDGRKLFVEGLFFVGGEQVVRAEGVWICARGDYRWREGFPLRQQEVS